MATVVWLNGPFGVGKTTTARLLVAGEPSLRLFDPEWVGYLLREHLADVAVDDFQHYPSWCRLVPVVADELATATGQHLVAVQSVLDEARWTTLRAGLRRLGHDVVHVVLDAPPDVIRARATHDSEEPTAVGWRHHHVAAYLDAMSTWLPGAADRILATDGRSPEHVANEVAEVVRELAPIPARAIDHGDDGRVSSTSTESSREQDALVATALLQGVVGTSLIQFRIGYGLHLELGYDLEITIETALSVAGPEGHWEGEPLTGQAAAALVPHNLSRVGSLQVACSGTLTIRIGEATIEVAPHPDYEAWQARGPGDLLVVCLPGGALSIWEPST